MSSNVVEIVRLNADKETNVQTLIYLKKGTKMVSIDFDKTGERIDELRKENGFTVRQIQNIFGFGTPQTIYKWIHGASLPKIDNLVVLADIFHVTIDDIIVLKKEV